MLCGCANRYSINENMPNLSDNLLQVSVQAALSSIEVYNKPAFDYREQTFTILHINAWELLLKAKILKDNAEELEALYVKRTDGSFKINRTGNPMTVEIMGAMRLVSLDSTVAKNLEQLVAIRDTAVHFYHDMTLSYVVYVLGVAALRNYQKLAADWFNRSLLEYNFYILPLGFAYTFQTLSLLDLEGKPDAIANLVRSVTADQSAEVSASGFHFTCEVTTKLVSAKKFSLEPDIVAAVDPTNPPGAIVVERLQRLTDKYPLSYTQVWQRVRAAKPHVKQGQMNQVMKEIGIRGNPSYSSYNFMSKMHRDRYEKDGILPKAVACIYNEDAVRAVIERLP
jgi:Protein of unknown function (DUF3644)